MRPALLTTAGARHIERRFEMQPDSTTTFVYFISAGSGPIKIGLSDNPSQRLNELQTAHYKKLYLLYTIECTSRSEAYKLESAFHRWYSEVRLMNEWFSIDIANISTDIELLRSLNQSAINIEQVISQPEKSRIEYQAKRKEGIKRAKRSIRLEKAIDWLKENPEHLDTPSRELEPLIGVSYGTIFSAQQYLRDVHNGYIKE